MALLVRLMFFSVAMFVAVNIKASSAECVPGCPTYWTAFNYNCYRYFGEYVNLRDARYQCRSFGRDDYEFAYLVSIHSQEENDYVAALYKSYRSYSDEPDFSNGAGLWIGLNDEINETIYEWTDGNDLDYIRWGPGQPDNIDTQQGVIMMHPKAENYGKWHDAPEENLYNYMCKISQRYCE